MKTFLNHSKSVYLLLTDLFIGSVVILYVIDIVFENNPNKPDDSTFFSGDDNFIINTSYFDNLPLSSILHWISYNLFLFSFLFFSFISLLLFIVSG